MGCLFVFFSFIPPPCRFWRVGDESDDDDSDDLHNFDVVNVCVKKGKGQLYACGRNKMGL